MLTQADVTPARIALAYSRTGIPFAACKFFTWDLESGRSDHYAITCGCPATALACDCYMQDGGTKEGFIQQLAEGYTVQFIRECTGLTGADIDHIAVGWDYDSWLDVQRPPDNATHPLFLAARQARRELFPASQDSASGLFPAQPKEASA